MREYAAAQPGGALKVAFPGDSASGYTIVSPPKVAPGEGVGGTNRSGSVPVLMDSLLRERGVRWAEVPVSRASSDFSPSSSFTACVHEVALGNADMCWGNFWVTAQRRSLACFTGSLYRDHFALVVRTAAAEELSWSSLRRPFEPFSVPLWWTIIGLLAFIGIALVYESAAAPSSLRDFPFVSSMLRGIGAFNTCEVAGVDEDSTSWSSHVLTVALGFTVLVLQTGYTAVVTSRMVSRSRGVVSSLEEAIGKGYTFCVAGPVVADLSLQHPGVAGSIVDGGGISVPLLERMDRGECDAAIVGVDEWGARGQRHCTTKTALPGTVATVGVGMPLGPQVCKAVSWILELDGDLRYPPLVAEAKLNYTQPHSACTEGSAASGGAMVEFGLHDMMGPIAFLSLVALVSVALTFLRRESERRARRSISKVRAAIDTDGDGVLSQAELSAARRARGSSSMVKATAFVLRARRKGKKAREASAHEK